MSIFDKLSNKRTITNSIFLKEFKDENSKLQDINNLLEKVYIYGDAILEILNK